MAIYPSDTTSRRCFVFGVFAGRTFKQRITTLKKDHPTLLFLFPPRSLSRLPRNETAKNTARIYWKVEQFRENFSEKGMEREREREERRGRAQENACTNCGCRQKSGIRVDVETEGGSSRGKGEKGEGMKRARVQWGTGKGKLLQSERGGENT